MVIGYHRVSMLRLHLRRGLREAGHSALDFFPTRLPSQLLVRNASSQMKGRNTWKYSFRVAGVCSVFSAMHAGVSLLDAADDEDGAASDGAAQAPAREYVPPPAKLDDPEENYKILTSWRGNIHAAQECFRKLDMEGAERELKTALEKAAHFGSGSAPVATSLVNLAELYRRLGRFKEALPLLERATDTLDQTAGPNNKARAQPLDTFLFLFPGSLLCLDRKMSSRIMHLQFMALCSETTPPARRLQPNCESTLHLR
eukprot:5485964-Pleurochrysis_carterae.AAC.2